MAGVGIKAAASPVQLPLPALVSGVDYPVDNPSSQAGWDTFSPTGGGSVGGSAGLIGSLWPRQGGKGKSFTASGWQFDATTRLKIWGQTTGGNGVLTNSITLRLTGNSLVSVVDAGQIANSAYLVWPYSSITGYGNPFKINYADPWWLQTDYNATGLGLVGGTCYVRGQNLANLADPTKTWIYVTPSAGGGTFVASTSVNPYEVAFPIPSLPLGNYDVWLHNGGGGVQRGWAKCPGQLTITTDYFAGAASTPCHPAGGTSDSAANFNNAITALSGAPGKVILDTGTYYLGSSINATIGGGNAPWFVGQGKGVTIIKTLPGFNAASMFTRGKFSNLTIDTTNGGTFPGGAAGSAIGGVDIACVNVAFDLRNVADWIAGIDPFGSFGLGTLYDGCDFIGWGVFGQAPIGLLFRNCTWKLAAGSDAGPAGGVTVWYSMNTAIINSTCQDLDYQGGQSKRGNARFFNSGVGQCFNCYIGGLTTTHLGLDPGIGAQNKGEQNCFEGSFGSEYQAVASATLTTTTLAALTGSYQPNTRIAIITTGKGTYQSRLITSIVGTTLHHAPWDLVPDTSSSISIEAMPWHVVLYNHNLQSIAGAGDSRMSFTFFSGVSDSVIDGLTSNQMKYGFNIQTGGSTVAYGAYNVLIQNSTWTDTDFRNAQLWDNGQQVSTDASATMTGIVIRNCSWSGPVTAAPTGFTVLLVDPLNDKATTDLVVWENNTMTDVKNAIFLGSAVTVGISYVDFYNSSFTLGSAVFSGSQYLNGTSPNVVFGFTSVVHSGFQT